MKQTKTTFLTLLFTFGAVIFSFSQEKISKKDQKNIREVCEVFLRNEDVIYGDSSASADSLFSSVSDALEEMMRIRWEYNKTIDLGPIEFSTPLKVSGLSLKDSIGCIMKVEESEYLIKTEKIENKWTVVGFNNVTLDESDIERLKKAVQRWREEDSEKDSIRVVLGKFVSAWSDYRQYNDSLTLMDICTNEFYSFMSTMKKYDAIRGRRNGPVSLREITYVQGNISADTAWTRLAIRGEGGSRFPVLRIDGKWLVAGADGRICTQQDTKDIEERIEAYYERKVFNEYIENFNDCLNDFFKTGKRDQMEELATDRLMKQMDIYRNLAGTYDPDYVKFYGIRTSMYPEFEIKIYDDVAYYEVYSDSIRWIKQNGKWLIDEMFCSVNISDPLEKAHTTFSSFIDVTSLSYSDFNKRFEKEYSSTPPPPVPPAPAPEAEIIDFPDEVDYSKTKRQHRLDDYNKEVVYEAGFEQLAKDLRSATKKVTKKSTFKGIVYVEFDVDNLGKAQNYNVLTELSEQDAALAIEIINQLGDWLPNDNPQSSLTNMVLAIEFK